MSGFIPDTPEEAGIIAIPFFEDATSDIGIKGHATTKSIKELRSQLVMAISRLGGTVESIDTGTFPDVPPRRGMRVSFTINGHPGRLEIAALPFRDASTPKKEDKALRMALYNVIDSLEASYNLLLMSPGSMPLMQYMLAPGTDQTIAESLMEKGDVPRLTARASDVIIDGELADEDDDETG